MKRLLLMTTMALLLSGCGLAESDPAPDTTTERANQTPAQAQATKTPAPFTPGPVRVRTTGNTAVTETVTRQYQTETGSVNVEIDETTDEKAFRDMCTGKVDIVDSSRRIPEDIWNVCQDHGLDVVEFHIASDAIVLTTRAETDTGADCLTQKQVRDIYRAGSPYYRWSQFGYDDIPLRVAGTDEESPSFQFFATYVLGSAAPAISDVRSDYRAHESDNGTRLWIVGTDEDQRTARLYESYAQRVLALRAERDEARASLTAARTELRLARTDRQRGIRDQRPQSQQKKDQARQDRAWAAYGSAAAYYKRAAAELAVASERQRTAAAARSRINRLLGRLGFVRFSYYGLYEDQLRPLEIDAADEGAAQSQCIFPSSVTITSGQYPYARPVLITTTTRSLQRPEVKGLIENYLARAREAALAEQLIPVTGARLNEQLGWLKADPELIEYERPEQKDQQVPKTEPAK